MITAAPAGRLAIPFSVAAPLAGRRSPALRIGLRIVGSCFAAIGLMLLALALRS